MAIVSGPTISGGGIVQTTITAGSNDVTGVAQQLANVISAGLQSSPAVYTRTNGPAPGTGSGVYTINTANSSVTLQPGVGVVLVAASQAAAGPTQTGETVVGAGGSGQILLGDNENINYYTGGGSSTVITGDGNNSIGTPSVGGGNLNVQTGAGNDTISIFSGNATISAGAGSNTIYAGDPVASAAFSSDIVINAGAGSDVISFTNHGSGVTAAVYINGFGSDDAVQLNGFTSSQQTAVNSAAANNSSVTLSDGTQVIFGSSTPVFRFFDTTYGTSPLHAEPQRS